MERIVVSGISGRFPQSNNITEFKENLMNKVYLVGDPENRIKFKFPGVTTKYGLMKNLDKFDYTAFPRVNYKLAEISDPQMRFISEDVNQAILDAGVSPRSLFGSNTGVYVGCFNYDSLEHWMCNIEASQGLVAGANMAFSLSNRISYMLGFHGPSLTVDTACSSSMYALNLACKDIQRGECESAIVVGTNLILNPFLTRSFSELRGGLAPNAISQPFDKNSSGFVRSEAVCILFLQKHHKANRVYAEILHSRTINDGYKREGPPFPSLVMQKELYSKVYSEANIDPNDVDFLEAHATSTHIGDKYEVTSIDEFFCKNRDRPLKVGSVKGNTGHTEGASGAVSLVKAILMFENGKTIPNINITELRDDCPGIVEKRMKVVQEVEDFDGKIIGVNNFGVVGANAHTILARNEKVKVDGGFPTDDLPRLLLWSGRTLDAVNTIFNEVLSKPIDDEFLALLQNSQIIPMSTAHKKGFAIFKSNTEDRSTICVDRQIKPLEKQITRPIVFVYAGMGSQWLEMGKDLLKIPLIAESIEKCHQVLLNHNLDLKHILTSNDPNTFSNCLNISVGITSIQIALTDLLFKIGIKPNNFIGHSIGELACAYADGTLTLEQTILLALSRGQAIIEGMEKPGAMAAVAMTYDELQKILPNDIEIACHNAEESCTISGPIESVENFVKEIKSKQILAKIVDTCNVAYHSSLIAKSGPILTQKLRKIITEPKKRSSKWIPTGIVNEKDDYSSIEYHVNNVIGPVRFAEGVSKLPKDSLMIEIAPHGLLQPLLKQLNPGGVCFSLTQRGVEDGVINLLQSIGRIYQTGGVEIDIRQMYPKINYPVSRGTPMISPLIRWLHDESIAVPMYDPLLRCDKRNIVINLGEKKYSFMKGHEIDDRIIIPATGYLYFVTETLAMMHGADLETFSVCIEDVKLMKPTILTPSEDIELTITIERGSGEFELVQRDESICRGKIRPANENEFLIDSIEARKIAPEHTLKRDDFYKELKLRGYQYKADFQLIDNVECFNGKSERFGEVEWRNNLVSFADCMCQPFITNTDIRELALPVAIRKVIIDQSKHFKMLENLESCKKVIAEDGETEKILFDLIIDEQMKIYRCGGIEIIEPEFQIVSRRKNNNNLVLESYEFVSHVPTPAMTMKNAAKFCLQIFLENTSAGKFNIVEIDGTEEHEPFIKPLSVAINETPLFSPTCYLITKRQIEEIEDVKILTNDLSDMPNLEKIDILVISDFDKLKRSGNLKSFMIDNIEFLLLRNMPTIPTLPDDFKFIANIQVEEGNVLMFRKNAQIVKKSSPLISAMPENFELIANIQNESEHACIFRKFRDHEELFDPKDAVDRFKLFAKIQLESEEIVVFKKFIGEYLETDFGFCVLKDPNAKPVLPEDFRPIANIESFSKENIIVFKKFEGGIIEHDPKSSKIPDQPMQIKSDEIELVANVQMDFEHTLVYKKNLPKESSGFANQENSHPLTLPGGLKLLANVQIESENIVVYRREISAEGDQNEILGLLVSKDISSNPKLPEEYKILTCVPSEDQNLIFFENSPRPDYKGDIFEIPSALTSSFEWIEDLKKLFETSNDIIIFTRSEFSGVLGFFKCLTKEHIEKKLRCFLIEDPNAPDFDVKNPFYKKQIDLGLSINVYHNGKWGTHRHLSFNQEFIEKSHSEHAFIHQLTKADLSSLYWVNGEKRLTSEDEVINIHYGALNFRDILIANARISMDYEYANRITGQYQIGLEFSGMTNAGIKVAGMCGAKALASSIDKSNELMYIKVPDDVTLEEAATIPVVYSTIYLAFFFEAQIEYGKSILIHSGSGGLGQAAIRTAIAYGLRVFTTCGSKEKREFLLSEFPELEDEDIGNSRDLSFEKMIMKRTNGRGVDYVINSLAEDKMQASLRCLAESGTFFEVGKFDIHVGNYIKLKHFLKKIKYVGIFPSIKFFKKYPDLGRSLMKKIEDDIKLGIIKPIKRTVFKANEVEKAFRFMASGKHIGKVLIQVRESDESKQTLPMAIKSRVYFNPLKSYIIPGGLGGMGMEIADWMVLRNCKKLVLSSSRGISNTYQSYRIKIWESYGVKVIISTANIKTKEGCEELLKTATQLGPVGGIFNLAVVLHDCGLEKQSEENFRKCFEPKSLSTKYLDELSRVFCPQLEHFVFFSSVSCGRGSGAQTNYGLSNSVGEKIIELRRRDNLPGKAIQFGPIKDVGLLSETSQEIISGFGYLLQNMQSCCDVFDQVFLRHEAVFSSMICASKKKAAGNDYQEMLMSLLGRIGITDEATIDPNQTLASLGVDSISGVEIQQFFLREFGITMTVKELRLKTYKETKDLIQKMIK